MKLWLRNEATGCEREIYTASDGTVSDRQLLAVLKKLEIAWVLVLKRTGRHTRCIQHYGVPVLWTDPVPDRWHWLIGTKGAAAPRGNHLISRAGEREAARALLAALKEGA